MLALYDLEDNLITVFESYKECAAWFNTSIKCIHSYICKSKKGIIDKKRDKKNKQWYRIHKYKEEE